MKNLSQQKISAFQKQVYGHFIAHGRALPWRQTTDPYHIVISEIMLQQTQVDRVVPKYTRWLSVFPDFPTLAAAPLKKILREWHGLGYNRRALALKKLAQIVTEEYKGILPKIAEELDALPGIGPHTAGSIAAFAFNLPTIFIETNIRSVFIHAFFPNTAKVSDADILPLVEQTLDRNNPRRWYNALMDYGVYLKKHFKNPSRKSAHHTKQTKFEGSNRQLRGEIIKHLLRGNQTVHHLARLIGNESKQITPVLLELQRDGFVVLRSGKWCIKPTD